MRSQNQSTAGRRLHRVSESAQTKVILLLLISLLAGAVLSALWINRTKRGSEPNTPQTPRLSDATKQALRNLAEPVQLRFYSILPKESASPLLTAFAGRVDELVSEYEREAGNKLKVTRQADAADDAAAAATADGIRGFNLDKGAACFLGITVAQNATKEALPQLFPEWENALESDLTRAILRVTQTQPSARAVASTATAQSNALGAIVQSIPNLNSVSHEEGRKILRERALKELKTATAEMQTKIQQAQQRLAAAQSGGSEGEVQAAIKELQEAQAQQSEKLKQMAADFQAQLAALEKLKRDQPK